LAWAERTREAGLPTIPSKLGDERKFNPFLLAADPNLLTLELSQRIQQLTGEKPLSVAGGADKHNRKLAEVKINDGSDNVQLIRALRALKDRGI
jgi:hypothetical protein